MTITAGSVDYARDVGHHELPEMRVTRLKGGRLAVEVLLDGFEEGGVVGRSVVGVGAPAGVPCLPASLAGPRAVIVVEFVVDSELGTLVGRLDQRWPRPRHAEMLEAQEKTGGEEPMPEVRIRSVARLTPKSTRRLRNRGRYLDVVAVRTVLWSSPSKRAWFILPKLGEPCPAAWFCGKPKPLSPRAFLSGRNVAPRDGLHRPRQACLGWLGGTRQGRHHRATKRWEKGNSRAPCQLHPQFLAETISLVSVQVHPDRKVNPT